MRSVSPRRAQIGDFQEFGLRLNRGPARMQGGTAAKALALGADAVSIGTAAMIALGCNRNAYIADYEALGAAPGFCHHCHTGRCPVGVTTMAKVPLAGADWIPGNNQ